MSFVTALRWNAALAFPAGLSFVGGSASGEDALLSASGLDAASFFANAGLPLATSFFDSSGLTLLFSAFDSSRFPLTFSSSTSSPSPLPLPFPFPSSFASSSFPFVFALPQSRNPDTFGFSAGLSSLVLGRNFGLSSCLTDFSAFTAVVVAVVAGLGSLRGAGASTDLAGGGASATGLPICAEGGSQCGMRWW